MRLENRKKVRNHIGGVHAAATALLGESVTGLAFVGDGEDLLSTGYDGRILIWDATGKLLAEQDTGNPITA